MKNAIAIILLIFLAASSAFAQKSKTDLARGEYKGKIKSVKTSGTYRYMQNGEFTPWAPVTSNLYVFDTNGNYTEVVNYKEDGSFNGKTLYIYEGGKNTQRDYYAMDNKFYSKTTFAYDAKGYMVEEKQFLPGGDVSRYYTYINDEKGNALERKGYKADGTLTSTSTWKYDSNGNMLQSDSQQPGYAKDNTYSNTYDANGLKTEQSSTYPNGKLFLRWTYKYDAKGNKIEELKYNGTGAEKDKSTWQYEYDSKGNWIKKTQFTSENLPFSIEERTIVYY